MVCGLVVPQKCIHTEDELSLLASSFELENNLFQNEEELVANATLTTVATARQVVEEVGCLALALSQ